MMEISEQRTRVLATLEVCAPESETPDFLRVLIRVANRPSALSHVWLADKGVLTEGNLSDLESYVLKHLLEAILTRFALQLEIERSGRQTS